MRQREAEPREGKWESGLLTRREVLERGAGVGASLAFGGVLAACDGGGGAGKTATGAGPTATGEGERVSQVLLGMADTPITLDLDHIVHTEDADAAFNLYDSLVGFPLQTSIENNVRSADVTDLQAVEGFLAEDWDRSPDGRTVTFKLRQGVISPLGNELTSEDVKFSFDMMKAGNTRSFMLFLGQFEPKDVKVIDKYTVSITSRTANPLLLAGLTLHLANIFDSTELKKHQTSDDPYGYEWLPTHSAGFGGYSLRELTSGQQAVFEANADYYRGPLSAEAAVYRAVPESSSRLSLLQQGAIQYAHGLSPRELKQASSTAGHIGNDLFWLFPHMGMEPYSDLNVRKAMAYAIPYQSIVDNVYLGTATVARGPIPNINVDYAGDELWPYDTDPERARDFLRRAGLESGVDVELAYNTAHSLADQIAVQVKSAWDAVGLRTKILRMDAATFGRHTLDHSLPVALILDRAFVPDVGYTMAAYFITDGIVNYQEYSNPEVDRLTVESLSTLEPSRRSEIHRRLQEILAEDVPWITIVQPGYHKGINDPLRTISWYPHNSVVFRDFEFARS